MAGGGMANQCRFWNNLRIPDPLDCIPRSVPEGLVSKKYADSNFRTEAP